MKYVAFWFAGFFSLSVVDALWHLVVFRRAYCPGFRAVAKTKDGKMALEPIPGLLSQVLVVSALVVLIVLSARAGQGYPVSFLVGACGGTLGISVYGLVNQALIKDWTWKLTVLEVVWGPIIGGLGGLFIGWLYRVI